MFGAVIGDIIGSTYEFSRVKSKDFELFPRRSEFTDDSIMTIAMGDALMDWFCDGGDLYQTFTDVMRAYVRAYPSPKGAYGYRFAGWLRSKNPEPYNSCGNGSAMRVSPGMKTLWNEASRHIPEELIDRMVDFRVFCRERKKV